MHVSGEKTATLSSWQFLHVISSEIMANAREEGRAASSGRSGRSLRKQHLGQDLEAEKDSTGGDRRGGSSCRGNSLCEGQVAAGSQVRMKDYLVLIGQELGEEGRIARDEAKGRGRGQRAQAKGIWLKILFLISVEGRNQGMTDWLVF